MSSLSTLGEVAEFVRGPFGGALKKEYFVGSGYSVYEQQHAINDQFHDIRYFIDDNKFRSLKRFELLPGDLIMSCSGTMGKIAIVPERINKGIINQALLKLTPKTNINKYYLRHWLESESFKVLLSNETHGAAIKNVPAVSVLKELKIPLPKLGKQKRIATILDKADAIRRKRQQAIDLADQFLRSVFLDMFGDPITNSKNWKVMKWNESIRIVNGKNQKAVEVENGEFPIVGSGGEMSRASSWLTKENSVIIGRKGNINKPILMKEKFWNVDTAFGLEPDLSILSHNYLYWFCKFFDFERLNKAVTIPSLTKVDLLNIDMPIPSLEKQNKFDLIVSSIESYIKKQNAFLELPLFNSLSQKAFSGKL